MPTEDYGQIYLHNYSDYSSISLEEDFSFSTFYPKFSGFFEEIKNMYNFGSIYEEEHIKSKSKTVLDNE